MKFFCTRKVAPCARCILLYRTLLADPRLGLYVHHLSIDVDSFDTDRPGQLLRPALCRVFYRTLWLFHNLKKIELLKLSAQSPGMIDSLPSCFDCKHVDIALSNWQPLSEHS
ncbi:hypothetical protein DACRYDRAFT_23684 [Dacryopinax primogenitus]|uniref:Uncharacterized protein n=1 Tax=Dacryopinax primogenitus (strain DJM 731) TaxID=1858805 RepID=M5FVG8_DACPD|nr:uncharacterized protein DACRYDRAFT_23684 [Dacryopinax primogenitus]EJT99604.1 hypothetical protein DACRYDRAFT_23684 [Dacryopinax primogenitus]